MEKLIDRNNPKLKAIKKDTDARVKRLMQRYEFIRKSLLQLQNHMDEAHDTFWKEVNAILVEMGYSPEEVEKMEMVFKEKEGVYRLDQHRSINALIEALRKFKRNL